MKRLKQAIYLGTFCKVLILGITFFVIACIQSSPDKPIELKFATSMPAGHPITTNAFEVWARKVEETTHKRVKITIFPGDTLISPMEAYDATRKGACDISMLVQSYKPRRFSLTMVMNQPLDLPNAVVSSKIAWELFQEFPEIRAEYKDVKLLFFFTTSPYQIHTAKMPIHSKKDLEGLLIRVGGPVDKAISEALGGVPEFLHMPDTYLALGKGVLDAHLSPFGPMKGLRTADVTRFHLENTNLHVNIFGIIMNLKIWNKLPSDIRRAIEQVSGLAGAELFGSVFDGTDRETKQYMKDQGDIFIQLSTQQKTEWAKFLKSIAADWVEEQEARGLPGQKILDTAIRLKKKYSAQIERKNSLFF